jgi:hypothetical protein
MRGRDVSGVKQRQIPRHSGLYVLLQAHHFVVAQRLGGVAGGEPLDRGGGADPDGRDLPALVPVRFEQQGLQQADFPAGQVRRLLIVVGASALVRDRTHDRRLAPAA